MLGVTGKKSTWSMIFLVSVVLMGGTLTGPTDVSADPIREASTSEIQKWNVVLGAGIGGINYLGEVLLTSEDFRLETFGRYMSAGAISGGIIYEAKEKMGRQGFENGNAWEAHVLSSAGGSIGRNIIEHGYTGFWHNYAIDLGPVWFRADLKNGYVEKPLLDVVSLASATKFYTDGATLESFDGGYLHFRAEEPGPVSFPGSDGNFAGVASYNVIKLSQGVLDNQTNVDRAIIEHERIHAMQLSHDYLSPLGATGEYYDNRSGIGYYGYMTTGALRLYDIANHRYENRWQEREAESLSDLGRYSN